MSTRSSFVSHPMPPTIIKICGITRLEDGLAALNAGADWLGFIRWPGSARFRPVDECAALVHALREAAPGPFEAVAVYVNASAETIHEEFRAAGFDRAQLHGEEPLEFARSLGLPVIKTIKIRDVDSTRQADAYPDIDLLTDTADAMLPGGTGRGYDVGVVKGLVLRRRVVVAGGLKPENVGKVVRELRPFGVDVSSGVETSPGVKDSGKIERFVQSVRAAEWRAQIAPGN